MYDTGPSWIISEDSLRLRLVLAARPDVELAFDALATDVMIATVAKLRASMLPPVDLRSEPPTDMQAATFSGWRLFPRGRSGATLATAHPGYGWVSLALEPSSMRILADALTRLAERADAAPVDGPAPDSSGRWDGRS